MLSLVVRHHLVERGQAFGAHLDDRVLAAIDPEDVFRRPHGGSAVHAGEVE